MAKAQVVVKAVNLVKIKMVRINRISRFSHGQICANLMQMGIRRRWRALTRLENL